MKRKMHLFLILDLGTSWIKIILLDENLRVAREKQFPTPFEPYSGIPVIDPRTLMDRIYGGVRSLAVDEPAAESLSVSVTGMGSTILSCTPDGEILAPAISWEHHFEAAPRGSVDLDGTGKVILPTYPVFKIPWLRERVRGRKAVYLSLPDYVLAAFGGFQRFVSDYSFASRSLLFSDLKYDWDPGILEYLHLSPAELPELSAAGDAGAPVSKAIKAALRLPAGSRLFTGMHDHLATACLGARLSDPAEDAWVNAAGTTESLICTVRRNPELVRAAPAVLLNTEAAWDERTLALVGYSCPSGRIMKAAEQFGIDWQDLEKGGSASLLLAPPRRRNLPDDAGRLRAAGRAAISWNSFWRQLVLSTQFELRRVMEDMKSLIRTGPRALFCFGGQAGNEHLCRLKCAVTGLSVYAFPRLNAAVLGTALWAAHKNGILPEHARNGVLARIRKGAAVWEPDAEAASRLDACYERYKREVDHA